jgi:hypothetical protein
MVPTRFDNVDNTCRTEYTVLVVNVVNDLDQPVLH